MGGTVIGLFFGGLCRPATRVSMDTHDERVGFRRRGVMVPPETTNPIKYENAKH
jgi:hypothetical protein